MIKKILIFISIIIIPIIFSVLIFHQIILINKDKTEYKLSDIKIDMTVWIKKGKTSVESFGVGFTDSIMKTIGTSVLVDGVDPGDPLCTVSAGDWWYPADWISLTPPKDASKEAPKEKKKLYVSEFCGSVTQIGTIDEVIKELKDGWDLLDEDIAGVKFYELTEVQIKYTPVKYEVVER